MLVRVKIFSSYLSRQVLEDEINGFIEQSELAYNDREFHVVDIKFQPSDHALYALVAYEITELF